MKPSLLREAQAAMLDAFDGADTITAAQLQAATPGFSQKTVDRGRAEFTREGVLIRSKSGMEGEITYTLDRRRLASLMPQMADNALSVMKYRARPFPKNNEQRRRMADNTFLTEEYDDDDDSIDDDDDDDGDELDEDLHTAGGSWGWLLVVVICVGLGGIVLARRRSALFSIASADGMPLPPYLPADRLRRRTYSTVAPYPGDDAIFGPDPRSDETYDRNRIVRSTACDRFATFPNVYDFGPQSGA